MCGKKFDKTTAKAICRKMGSVLTITNVYSEKSLVKRHILVIVYCIGTLKAQSGHISGKEEFWGLFQSEQIPNNLVRTAHRQGD